MEEQCRWPRCGDEARRHQLDPEWSESVIANAETGPLGDVKLPSFYVVGDGVVEFIGCDDHVEWMRFDAEIREGVRPTDPALDELKRRFAEHFNFYNRESGVYFPSAPHNEEDSEMREWMWELLWIATGGTPPQEDA